MSATLSGFPRTVYLSPRERESLVDALLEWEQQVARRYQLSMNQQLKLYTSHAEYIR